MKNVEKLPKNFASVVDDECIERKHVNSVAQLDVGGSVAGSPTAEPALVTCSPVVSSPSIVRDVEEDGRSRAAPEQVALGGRDGKFLSCLKVPGVTGYLIAC